MEGLLYRCGNTVDTDGSNVRKYGRLTEVSISGSTFVLKYLCTVRDGFCESMNQPGFKNCRADETSVLPLSTHNLPFNPLSKLFSPANRWSRRQKHARDARFGTQKKIRCRCAVRRRCLLSFACLCGNVLFKLNRRVCVFRARRECGNILHDLQV